MSVREIPLQITRDLRRGMFDLLRFEILFKAATLLVLLPLVAWAFRWVVRTSGHEAVGNLDILAFLLTNRGLLAGTTTLLAFLTVAFAETAGLLCIGYGLAGGRQVTYLDALKIIGLRLGRIMRASFLGCAVALLLAAPFVAGLVLIYERMLSSHDINYYLAARPPELYKALWLGVVLLAPAIAAVLIVYLVASYAVPGLLFGGRHVRSAYTSSLSLLRRHGLLLVVPLVVWLALWLVVSMTVNWAGFHLGSLAVGAAGTNLPALLVVLGILLALNLFLGLAFSFLLVTVNAALIARLYREACRRSSIPLQPLELGTAPGERPARRVKGRRVLAAALASVFLGVATVWGIVETEDLEDPIKVTAHRGSSRAAPENTLAAVRQALAEGADFVEIDVQLTDDGVVVVAHDADLMRIAGDPRVLTRSSFAELRGVDVGSWFRPEFASERLPTLDEVIAAVRGRAGLLVEIKSYRADGLLLVAKVVEALRAQGMSDTAAIMSLEYAEVREARRLAPEIPAGFVASATIGRVDRLDVDFLAVPVARARSVLITAAHQQQKQVWVWTVNDRAQMWRLIDYGVNNIITDEPATLREVIREREELDSVERLLLRFRHIYID